MPYYFAAFQEIEEADYQIIVQKRNLNIIKEQIRQLGLLDCSNFYKVREKTSVTCCSSKADLDANSFIAISIRIPPKMIDEKAQKDKSTTDITHIHNNFLTKTKYNTELID